MKPQIDEAIEREIERLAQLVASAFPQAGPLFRQCYLNTFETTTDLLDDGTTFVFTGDIPAMWLRDSSAQVRPYIRLAAASPSMRRVIAGLIRRQARYILLDPYANAFNREPNGHGHQSDWTAMHPWVWERKFELDSLCYPIQLCKDYWDATRDRSPFDETVHGMLGRIVQTMRAEQQHERDSRYRFARPFALTRRESLARRGRGGLVAPVGLVWSGFRPSDDACTYGFHIPSNMFAAVALGHVAAFATEIFHDATLAADAARLREDIDQAIQAVGLAEHPQYGQIFAYETDGRGHYNMMDDANIPSLLAIPYLGYCAASDPAYQRTRAFVLSRANPYYVEGAFARGVGSPHTPRGYLWPLGLIVQGLTSADPAEQRRVIDQLVSTTAGTGYMHESFDPNRPTRFTRPWFAWANSMFAELLIVAASASS
jgi:meiotically up-regulated gene 157 (Mug157) protein